MEYRDLEMKLFKYTDGWNMNEGAFPLESKSDLENAEAILSKRYSKVDKHHLDMQRKEIDGTDYKIEFSEPYLEEERKKRELTFIPDLDPEVANQGPIGKGLGQGGLAEDLEDSNVFRMFVEEFNNYTLDEEEQSSGVIEDIHDEVVIDELPELEEVGDDEFGLEYLLDEETEVEEGLEDDLLKAARACKQVKHDSFSEFRIGVKLPDDEKVVCVYIEGVRGESEFNDYLIDDFKSEVESKLSPLNIHAKFSVRDYNEDPSRDIYELTIKLMSKGKKAALDDLDLEESIEKHDELNPDLFDNETLKPEVKEKIEEIVQHFKDNLKEDEIELDIKDILLVGSNASFNYTDDSDIDVHIVADTSIYEDKADLAAKLYEAHKRLFNNKYDPTIRGHEVEIYVDPNENHAKSNGIYSLNNGWVKEPENNDIPEVNQEEVDKAVAPFEERANNVNTLEEVEKLIDDIYVVRQQGILEDGEYSLGNLTFKEFRNKGYLEKLKDMKIELENKEMSLESLQEDTDTKKETFLNYCEGKVEEDLGTVYDPEEEKEYEVVMLGDIREYKDVHVVIDENDYDALVGYVGDERVIATPMIAAPEYAFRMEFTKIKRSFLDELMKYWEEYSYLMDEDLDEGKIKDFAKKAVKALDDATFEKTSKIQVNFAEYEKDIADIMDQYEDVIDAAHAAVEFLVYDAKDKHARELVKTKQGYDNLMDYLEEIARYEGVGERQKKAERDEFKDDVHNLLFEPEDESLTEEANEIAKSNAKRFAKFLEETTPDFEDGIEIEHFGDHEEILLIGYDADGVEAEFKVSFKNDGSIDTHIITGDMSHGDVEYIDDSFNSFNTFMRWVNKEGGKYLFDASDLANDYYDTEAPGFDKLQNKLNALDELDLEEDVNSDKKELALSKYLQTEVKAVGDNTYEDVEAGIDYLVLTEEEAYNEAINAIKSLYDDLKFEAFSSNFLKDFGDDPAMFNEEEVNNAIENEIEYLEDESPEVADNLRNANFEERVDYLVGLYGEDMLEELYDINKIAEMVVEMDGVAGALASYDGNEIDLGNDLFAYRLN